MEQVGDYIFLIIADNSEKVYETLYNGLLEQDLDLITFVSYYTDSEIENIENLYLENFSTEQSKDLEVEVTPVTDEEVASLVDQFVEDIVDTAKTLTMVIDFFKKKNPSLVISIRTVLKITTKRVCSKLLRCVQTKSNEQDIIARNTSIVSLDHNWIIFLIITSVA